MAASAEENWRDDAVSSEDRDGVMGTTDVIGADEGPQSEHSPGAHLQPRWGSPGRWI